MLKENFPIKFTFYMYIIIMNRNNNSVVSISFTGHNKGRKGIGIIMKDFEIINNILNGNTNIDILEKMKNDVKKFDERRESLIKEENALKKEMSNDGFDDIMSKLGIF